MKINFFTKKNSFKKRDFNFNTSFYWKIAVISGFLMIILVFFFGYNLFVQINKETILPDSSAGGQSPTVNKEKLEKVLNIFSGKEEKSLQIINSRAPVVDPSL
ncbi:hypothetical protein IT399_02120 [Candidatus Nomurabacteria bacterium]|nr:hypothetical protein [Candidatus Nomurabacteria bacterium]